LDIGLIRERILNKSDAFISELASVVSPDRDVSSIIKELLDDAYVATINKYAENPAYEKIDSSQLDTLLSALSNATVGNIRNTILSKFKRTKVVTNVTKKNKSVMVILPKFTTLKFGTVFKEELSKLLKKTKKLSSAAPVVVSGWGSTLGAKTVAESEKSRMEDFISANFGALQNVGHIEVDVVSEVDKTVKRAQNSPRFLQALMTLPNDLKSFEKLQLKFSKETGQAATRLKIRKKFTGSKLVFELLVEHGLSVGIPESQKDNLYKARLEKAFSIGAGFTNTIRKDLSILPNLETSKSMLQYLTASIVNNLTVGKPYSTYTSNTEILQATKIKYSKVSSKTGTTKTSNSTRLLPIRTTNGQFYSLAALQGLLDAQLQHVIAANMGNGSEHKILNYRTGRFAESVKVERLSKSRQGMITAFYSYMKNPYQTFEPGFRQGSPTSRDPKLLISQSIREIAASKVGNRLRAVLI